MSSLFCMMNIMLQHKLLSNTNHFKASLILAFQAGILNAGGFIACHRFVTHTTGFATFFGVELVQAEYKTAIGMLIVPLFFLMGAMISAIYVDRALHQQKHPKFHFVFFLMTCILSTILFLGVSGDFGQFGAPDLNSELYLVAMLCLCSGMQNASLTTASNKKIRTTHLTGLTTDLGIGLVRQFINHETTETKDNVLRVSLIFSFIFGSTVGAFLFYHFHYMSFALPLFITLSFFIMTQLEWSRRHDRTTK